MRRTGGSRDAQRDAPAVDGADRPGSVSEGGFERREQAVSAAWLVGMIEVGANVSATNAAAASITPVAVASRARERGTR